jgi:hypothetical protein
VRRADFAYLSLVSDEMAEEKMEHSYFAAWDAGIWRGSGNLFEWDTVSMCVCKFPIEQGVALGPRGEVRCVGSGDIHEEKIGKGDESPEKRGALRGIRSIEGKAYAVGMNRQVYRRDDRDQWTCIDQSAL